jgi:hypothetical protein
MRGRLYVVYQTLSGLLVSAAEFASLSLTGIAGIVGVAPYVSPECYGNHGFARWIHLNALKVSSAQIELP